EGDAAVFAGLHAVRAVKPNGATRWEVRHACWGECSQMHFSSDEYADDVENHRYPDSGSAAVSADGKLVWAHVRGPLSGDEGDEELWLVLDAVDGTVLGRVETGTVTSGSYPVPHPDPTQMGLSIGEGEEGSPALWGRWDGHRLSVERIGEERILLAVSPSGRRLLSVDIGQWTLSLHENGSVPAELDAQGVVPPHPDSTSEYRVYWDYEATFLDENTAIAGTTESEARYATARHWSIDVRGMTLRGEVSYPFPVFGSPRSAGNGTWYTLSEDRTSLHLWRDAS
ncbi:hypothetical protein ACFQ07_30730, partial [Actinomadura adrarensis]